MTTAASRDPKSPTLRNTKQDNNSRLKVNRKDTGVVVEEPPSLSKSVVIGKAGGAEDDFGDEGEGEVGGDEWVMMPTKEEESIGFEKFKGIIQKLLFVAGYGAVFAFDMSTIEPPRK